MNFTTGSQGVESLMGRRPLAPLEPPLLTYLLTVDLIPQVDRSAHVGSEWSFGRRCK